MGVWANISKRAEGTLKRREDNNDFWESGSYTGTLDSDTKELLHAIHDFKGFAPFLPKDILKPDGERVRVLQPGAFHFRYHVLPDLHDTDLSQTL